MNRESAESQERLVPPAPEDRGGPQGERGPPGELGPEGRPGDTGRPGPQVSAWYFINSCLELFGRIISS